MPNLDIKNLTGEQKNAFARYYVMTEFASYGWKVTMTDSDDSTVDFSVAKPGMDFSYEVKVRSVSGANYAYVYKDRMSHDPENDPLPSNRLIANVRFNDGAAPDVYIFPAKSWENPGDLFVEHDYGKAGQKSEPEWGINYSEKNMPLLEQYKIERFINKD